MYMRCREYGKGLQKGRISVFPLHICRNDNRRLLFTKIVRCCTATVRLAEPRATFRTFTVRCPLPHGHRAASRATCHLSHFYCAVALFRTVIVRWPLPHSHRAVPLSYALPFAPLCTALPPASPPFVTWKLVRSGEVLWRNKKPPVDSICQKVRLIPSIVVVTLFPDLSLSHRCLRMHANFN